MPFLARRFGAWARLVAGMRESQKIGGPRGWKYWILLLWHLFAALAADTKSGNGVSRDGRRHVKRMRGRRHVNFYPHGLEWDPRYERLDLDGVEGAASAKRKRIQIKNVPPYARARAETRSFSRWLGPVCTAMRLEDVNNSVHCRIVRASKEKNVW